MADNQFDQSKELSTASVESPRPAPPCFSVSYDPSRCCTQGHQIIWLSTVGACDSCPQTFVALLTDGIACFRCGRGFVRRIECRADEPREVGEPLNEPAREAETSTLG